MKNTLITFSILMVSWLLWSGHDELLIIGFGVASCAIVTALARRMHAHDGVDDIQHGLVLRSITFVPWLLWQIIKSNLDVARAILHPRMPITPRLMQVNVGQTTELGQVIHANSITLTPGTITLDVRDGRFLVHALTRTAALGIESGDMDRRVTRLERKD